MSFKINGNLRAEIESFDGDPREGEFTLMCASSKETILDEEVYNYVMEHHFDEVLEEYYDQEPPDDYFNGDQSIVDVYDEHSEDL